MGHSIAEVMAVIEIQKIYREKKRKEAEMEAKRESQNDSKRNSLLPPRRLSTSASIRNGLKRFSSDSRRPSTRKDLLNAAAAASTSLAENGSRLDSRPDSSLSILEESSCRTSSQEVAVDIVDPQSPQAVSNGDTPSPAD